jgi:integrase
MIPREVCNLLDERMAGLSESDLVFPGRRGQHMRHGNFLRRYFRPDVQGLVEAGHWLAKLGSLRFHDLRHTCASLLIAEGVNPKAIQEQLGHSSITVTLDIYRHLYGTEREKVADAREAAFQAGTVSTDRATVTAIGG